MSVIIKNIEIKRKFRCDRLKELRNRPNLPFYLTQSWLTIRYQALKRSGRRCKACGCDSLNIRLHVDHIKPRSKFPQLSLDIDNLQVLCEPCNLGKGANAD